MKIEEEEEEDYDNIKPKDLNADMEIMMKQHSDRLLNEGL
jgi:hypothetical protein